MKAITFIHCNAVLLTFFLMPCNLAAQQKLIDGFEDLSDWEKFSSEGVSIQITDAEGREGKALRIDYDFTKGTGYGGVFRSVNIELPENYEFSFWLRAESPQNNFEIKFTDAEGANVWWVNNRNFEFPVEWKKIRIKKRHISFAWGPDEKDGLKKVERMEFTIASFNGGKGTIWIDGLSFESLPPETGTYPEPLFSASSAKKGHKAELMGDKNPDTYWLSSGLKAEVLIDLGIRREFNGFKLDWMEGRAASGFDVFLSSGGGEWVKVWSVDSSYATTSLVYLPEADARRIKLVLRKGNGSFGIKEVSLADISETSGINGFLTWAAKAAPPGTYPRYFQGQASYWTISGVNRDLKEMLINEDGMAEVEKGRFFVEPMVLYADTLRTWANVTSRQFLGETEHDSGFRMLPSVIWDMGGLSLTVSLTSAGEANKSMVGGIRYALRNNTGETIKPRLFLIIRPFQVNPSYQFLNNTGGAGRINSISVKGELIQVDEFSLHSEIKPDGIAASSFRQGNFPDLLEQAARPTYFGKMDPDGKVSGLLEYSIELAPGEGKEFYLGIPLYSQGIPPEYAGKEAMFTALRNSPSYWEPYISNIRFHLPPSADPILNTWKANLVYILMNRDNAGIQPGSRSYERSWIRDGALTSGALLRSGITEEVREFIEFYAPYQYESGKMPCVVDARGPDPVPEHDSHGEFIYLVKEYFSFTGDTAFLRSLNPRVLKAVDYIEYLIAQRSTDHFRNGNDSVRAYYGLVPESISHEGYSAKPMHSYWDNFFTIKGLKDAAEIQRILGMEEEYRRVSALRDTFSKNLYESIRLAMKVRKIDYIPGCVELGDFDATSTTIAITPCNELHNLPVPEVYNTFNRYYDFFRDRRDGKLKWENYTPYENRLIGSFIFLDQPERAHELIDYFLNDQRPKGFYHWAEVVWSDYRIPRFIGDMPHTWVGSDFINAVRSMFVYEDEHEKSLVVGAALYKDWTDAPEGMSVENLPTEFGSLSYSVRKRENSYQVSLKGDLRMPSGGIRIGNFKPALVPSRVIVNGSEIEKTEDGKIRVFQFPAEVEIQY